MSRLTSRHHALHGWQQCPIEENGEPLVALTAGKRLLVRPIYAERGIPGAPRQIHVREQVAARLRRAAAALPAGAELVVLDGWRPTAVQEALFERYGAELAGDDPGSPGAQAQLERFVSRPSADPAAPSPHLTGGAVDVTLRLDGAEADMGGAFDELTERSTSAYYDEDDGPDGRAFAERRRLLRAAMEGAGFVGYADEWWHFDFGDQFWGRATGRPACYGPAEAP